MLVYRVNQDIKPYVTTFQEIYADTYRLYGDEMTEPSIFYASDAYKGLIRFLVYPFLECVADVERNRIVTYVDDFMSGDLMQDDGVMVSTDAVNEWMTLKRRDVRAFKPDNHVGWVNRPSYASIALKMGVRGVKHVVRTSLYCSEAVGYMHSRMIEEFNWIESFTTNDFDGIWRILFTEYHVDMVVVSPVQQPIIYSPYEQTDMRLSNTQQLGTWMFEVFTDDNTFVECSGNDVLTLLQDFGHRAYNGDILGYPDMPRDVKGWGKFVLLEFVLNGVFVRCHVVKEEGATVV